MSRSRSKARRCAVQALYQWQLSGSTLLDASEGFLLENRSSKFDVDYFRTLLSGVEKALEQIDKEISAVIDRPLNEVDPVERAVLRLGVYELLSRLEIPYRVVINEALESNKMFGAEEGHRYVNGVLDRIARRVREVEVRGKQ